MAYSLRCVHIRRIVRFRAAVAGLPGSLLGLGAIATLKYLLGSCRSPQANRENAPAPMVERGQVPPPPLFEEEEVQEQNIDQAVVRPECPLSGAAIPVGREIVVEGDTYDIAYFTLAVVATGSNPMNRQPLAQSVIEEICNYFGIQEDLFRHYCVERNGSAASIIAAGQQQNADVIALNRQALNDEQQFEAVAEIQNRFSDEIREAAKENLIALITEGSKPEMVEVIFDLLDI